MACTPNDSISIAILAARAAASFNNFQYEIRLIAAARGDSGVLFCADVKQSRPDFALEPVLFGAYRRHRNTADLAPNNRQKRDFGVCYPGLHQAALIMRLRDIRLEDLRELMEIFSQPPFAALLALLLIALVCLFFPKKTKRLQAFIYVLLPALLSLVVAFIALMVVEWTGEPDEFPVVFLSVGFASAPLVCRALRIMERNAEDGELWRSVIIFNLGLIGLVNVGLFVGGVLAFVRDGFVEHIPLWTNALAVAGIQNVGVELLCSIASIGAVTAQLRGAELFD